MCSVVEPADDISTAPSRLMQQEKEKYQLTKRSFILCCLKQMPENCFGRSMCSAKTVVEEGVTRCVRADAPQVIGLHVRACIEAISCMSKHMKALAVMEHATRTQGTPMCSFFGTSRLDALFARKDAGAANAKTDVHGMCANVTRTCSIHETRAARGS